MDHHPTRNSTDRSTVTDSLGLSTGCRLLGSWVQAVNSGLPCRGAQTGTPALRYLEDDPSQRMRKWLGGSCREADRGDVCAAPSLTVKLTRPGPPALIVTVSHLVTSCHRDVDRARTPVQISVCSGSWIVQVQFSRARGATNRAVPRGSRASGQRGRRTRSRLPDQEVNEGTVHRLRW